MKISNILILLALSFICLTSCQKELDFENFNSAGTLKLDAGFDCLPSSVHGTYSQGALLADTNYIEVQVDVALSGAYIIQSDTMNGFSFRGEGYFNSTGLNTVRLFASGTPEDPGSTPFFIYYDSSFCAISVDVLATAGNAAYSFGGAGGTCTGAVVSGTYVEGTTTAAGNTATLNVDVTATGNYSISTTTTNGITFSGSGVFTSIGAQTVTLTASGTPTAAGSFDYPVSGASGSCAFSVTVNAAAPPATYTLTGTPGACTGAVLTGIYVAGIPTTPANTITVSVTVTVAGSYNISTPVQNGISFSGSGLFTTSTTQVTLTASGTPTAGGAYNFNINGSSSTCGFSIDVFSDYIVCDIDGVPAPFNGSVTVSFQNATAPTDLTFGGTAGSEQLFLTVQGITGTPIAVGQYDVNLPATDFFVGGDYTDAAATDWIAATDGTVQTPAFTINITSLIPGPGGRVIGTFSGPLKDGGGSGPNAKMITNGVFSVTIP